MPRRNAIKEALAARLCQNLMVKTDTRDIEVRNPKAIAIGNRIFRLRSGLSISQAQLAARIGVTENAITQYETGRATPRATRLEKLAMALDTTVEFILTGSDPDEVIKAQTSFEKELLSLARSVKADDQQAIVDIINVFINKKRSDDGGRTR